MSKRRSDTQLTKDDYEAQMNGGLNSTPSRTGNSDRPQDEADPSKMADSKVMSGRKIAPLKKGRGRGGAVTGARGGGSSIPNFFAATPSPAFGSNGNAPQSSDGGMSNFSGFGASNAASSTSSFGGNATGGGLSFGSSSGAPEQPKVNPFGPLAPSTPSSTNGSGGIFGQAQPQMGSGLFGNAPTQNAASGGIFGNNNNTPASASALAPASGGFTFGGSNSVAATQPPAAGFSKTPAFSFGGGSTAAPMFGSGDNKPAAPASTAFTFGSTSGAPATPPVVSPFNFGAPSSTATPGGYFAAPSPAPGAPEPPVTPAPTAPPSFQFGAATPTQAPPLFGKSLEPQASSSMFGKPAEPQGSSLFGRPSPSPEPSSSGLFTPRKPTPSPEPPNHFAAAPATPNFFGTPKTQETPKPMPMFGGFGDQKQEPAKDAPKPLFGGFSGPAKETPKTASTFSFNASPARDDDDSAMAGNSPPKQSIYDSQPVINNAFSGFSTTPTKSPFPTAAAAAAPTPTPVPMFTPPVPKTTTSTTTNNIRTPSPPLPSDAPSWTPAQLTEYYNLYALRSLNYTFVEGLKKMGSMGDYNGACLVYIKESAKIKAAQENGERYRGMDAKYSGLSSKRASGEEVEGSVKRRKEGEDSKTSDSSRMLAGIIGNSSSPPDLTKQQASKPLFGFVPPTASTSSASDQSQALASKPVHGFQPPTAGKSMSQPGPMLASKPLFGFQPPASMLAPSIPDLGQKLASKPVFGFNPPAAGKSIAPPGPMLASKPLFGFQPPAGMGNNGGSVFDNPTASTNNDGFVNPFTSQKPDPNDRDMGDDGSDSDEKKPSSTGSLFGRVSEPKPSISFSGSVLGTPTKASTSTGGLFSNKLDQTWSPDKGVKFESTNGNGNGSIFGAKSSGEAKPAASFFGSGSSNSSAATTPGASGTSSIFGTPGPKAEVGFSFGGNGTTKPSGPIGIPTSNETGNASEDGSEPSDNSHLAKNEIDLSAQGPGEEDEESLYQVRAIIYEIVGGGIAPKKAGVGTLRVLKNRITGKARVVTRTEGGKVVLNVGLVKEVIYALGDKGGKNVAIVEFVAGKKPKRFSVRVKEEKVAKELGEVMEDAKGN